MSTLVHYLEKYLRTDKTDKYPKIDAKLVLKLHNLLDRQYITTDLDYLSLAKNLTTIKASIYAYET